MSDTSDIIDRANVVADLNLNIALAAASSKRPVAEPTGFCLNCGEPLSDGKRWCNPECREDWEVRTCRKR